MRSKQNINYINLIIILATSFLATDSALAAKKNKKKTPETLEVYSATETDSPGAPSLNDAGVWDNNGPKIKAEPLKGTTMMTSEDDVEIPKEKTPGIPIKINEFDPVDPKQVDSITSRIRLVEQIIRKHKRAYDYRSNTTLELIEVMKFLDKTAAASKK